MKAIVLLKGDCIALKSFYDAMEDYFNVVSTNVSDWVCEGEFGESKGYSCGGSDELNATACDLIEVMLEIKNPFDKEEVIFTIEGYNKRLSKMLQDEFEIFELEVNKTGILSNGDCCFCLNYESETFSEECQQLLKKLSLN